MTSPDPAADDPTPDADDEAAASSDDGSFDTTAGRLAALQDLDTQIDQLTHRRATLPEREALAAATEQMKHWESERTAMRNRLDELESAIERAETEAAELSTNTERLQAQLKTVIAPREAEALMHEIETLDGQRDVVETAEIEALEEQARVDDELTSHLTRESSFRDAMGSADGALAAVVSEIDADLGRLIERRNEARDRLSDSLLARYDRIRQSSGVAVARLDGRRCEGCHLDMSAAEADDVKDEAAASGGIADCPQCGRILLV